MEGRLGLRMRGHVSLYAGRFTRGYFKTLYLKIFFGDGNYNNGTTRTIFFFRFRREVLKSATYILNVIHSHGIKS